VARRKHRLSESAQWSFSPWDGRHDRARFDCGEPVLNQWLREQAGQSERRDTARTFLALDPEGELGGYMSLCLTQIEAAHLGAPGLTARYPVSAIRLARLAVDLRYQGQGLGSYLLAQAVRLAHEVMERAAFQVLVVDALDVDVTAFYARRGFRRFRDDPCRLYLTAAQIRSSVNQAQEST
jgi:GNAT superfamily N-acetyltransferase